MVLHNGLIVRQTPSNNADIHPNREYLVKREVFQAKSEVLMQGVVYLEISSGGWVFANDGHSEMVADITGHPIISIKWDLNGHIYKMGRQWDYNTSRKYHERARKVVEKERHRLFRSSHLYNRAREENIRVLEKSAVSHTIQGQNKRTTTLTAHLAFAVGSGSALSPNITGDSIRSNLSVTAVGVGLGLAVGSVLGKAIDTAVGVVGWDEGNAERERKRSTQTASREGRQEIGSISIPVLSLTIPTLESIETTIDCLIQKGKRNDLFVEVEDADLDERTEELSFSRNKVTIIVTPSFSCSSSSRFFASDTKEDSVTFTIQPLKVWPTTPTRPRPSPNSRHVNNRLLAILHR